MNFKENMGNNAYTYLVLHLGAYLCGAKTNFFFFRFYANTAYAYLVLHLGLYLFWIFEIFGFKKKNIFGKMQSRADGGGKCPTMEGGFDICLFDVAAGGGYICWGFGFLDFSKIFSKKCRADGVEIELV